MPSASQSEAALGLAYVATASHRLGTALEELGVPPGVDHLVISLKKTGGDRDGQRESSENCVFEISLIPVAGA